MVQKKTAILIGATGLVGQCLLVELAKCYQKVIVIVRTPNKLANNVLDNVVCYELKDFLQLYDFMENLNIFSNDTLVDGFSCLGSTKKQAGSADNFRQIDFQINLNFAKICYQKGVKNFYLLSAMGANPKSPFLYNQVKGELEQAVCDLGFEYLAIFQPSLLLGEHQNRPLENLAQKAFAFLKPIIPDTLSIRPIPAEMVAKAMVKIACQADHKMLKRINVVSNQEMLSLAKE